MTTVKKIDERNGEKKFTTVKNIDGRNGGVSKIVVELHGREIVEEQWRCIKNSRKKNSRKIVEKKICRRAMEGYQK